MDISVTGEGGRATMVRGVGDPGALPIDDVQCLRNVLRKSGVNERKQQGADFVTHIAGVRDCK